MFFSHTRGPFPSIVCLHARKHPRHSDCKWMQLGILCCNTPCTNLVQNSTPSLSQYFCPVRYSLKCLHCCWRKETHHPKKLIMSYPCFSATAQLISITWPQIRSPAPSTSQTPTADVSIKSSQPHQWKTLWRTRRSWLELGISASHSMIPAAETEAKALMPPLQIPGVRLLLLHWLFKGSFLKGACLVTLEIAHLSNSETHPKGLLLEISECVSPSAGHGMVLQIHMAGRNARPEGFSDGHVSRGQWNKSTHHLYTHWATTPPYQQCLVPPNLDRIH